MHYHSFASLSDQDSKASRCLCVAYGNVPDIYLSKCTTTQQNLYIKINLNALS